MKAWELLAQTGWCQGWFAKNKAGLETSDSSKCAVAFCSLGAISRCYSDNTYPAAVDRLISEIGTHDVAGWNDRSNRTKEEVIAAMQRADV